MAFLHWQTFMATGNSKIDTENGTVVSLVNRLGSDVETARWDHARILNDRLRIEMYAHFVDEENIMRALHYPQFTPHRHTHDGIRASLSGVENALGDPARTRNAAEAFARLLARFDRDFFEADRRLAGYIRHCSVDGRRCV
jgi:hemerythrin-like metal-binding protein